MMVKRFKLARALRGLVAFALVSGCIGAGGPAVSPGGLLAKCGADGLLDLIGQPVSGFAAPAAAQTVRILRPGDPVTEDYSETRLNVILDDKDHISALSCG